MRRIPFRQHGGDTQLAQPRTVEFGVINAIPFCSTSLNSVSNLELLVIWIVAEALVQSVLPSREGEPAWVWPKAVYVATND